MRRLSRGLSDGYRAGSSPRLSQPENNAASPDGGRRFITAPLVGGRSLAAAASERPALPVRLPPDSLLSPAAAGPAPFGHALVWEKIEPTEGRRKCAAAVHNLGQNTGPVSRRGLISSVQCRVRRPATVSCGGPPAPL